MSNSKSVAACNVLQLLFTPNTIVNKIYTHNWEIKLIMLCHKNIPHCKNFLKIPVIDIIMCSRIWRYIDMNSIMCQIWYRLIFNFLCWTCHRQWVFGRIKIQCQCSERIISVHRYWRHVKNFMFWYEEKQTVSWSFLFHIRTYQSWFFAHVRLFFMLHI